MCATETIRPQSDNQAVRLPPAPAFVRVFRSVSALLLREMVTRYGRSPGGYLWALLEPIGGIILLSIGFSLVIHHPPLGNSFLLFYATGFLPFTLYQTVSVTVARSIEFSRSLMSYPVVSWIDAVIARLILNALTGLLITFITTVGIIAITHENVVLRPLALIEALGLAILLGFGIGLVNCFLMGMFPVWAMVWSIITKPLFIASGIILLYEHLSDSVRQILWYNPLIHIISMMRRALYPTYYPEDLAVGYTLFVSLSLIAMGLFLMRYWHRHILSR